MCEEYYQERMKAAHRSAVRRDEVEDLEEELDAPVVLLPSQALEESGRPTAKRLVR